MASKLFLISLTMIFLLRGYQANSRKKTLTYFEIAKLLKTKASEDQKIKFVQISFKKADKNTDGFVTYKEFANADFGTLRYVNFVIGAMTKAFIQEQKNGIEPARIKITFEDYKEAFKRMLDQVYKHGKIHSGLII